MYAANINIGLSSLIDEGQMELLLNTPKPIGHLGSQSNIIIGSILEKGRYDANSLLWARFWFQVAAVFVFSLVSLTYLLYNTEIPTSPIIYISLLSFTGGVSLYLFTKVISYNHILQLTVLWTASFYLLFLTFEKSTLIRYSTLFLIGFCALFSILNILPSGLAVSGSVTLAVVLNQYPNIKDIIVSLFFIVLGIITGLMAFHVCMKNLEDLINEICEMYANVSKLGRSYDTVSLLFNLSRTFLSLFVIFVITLGLLTLFKYLNNKIKNKYLPYIITLSSLALLLVYTIKYTAKANLGLSEWITSPLMVMLLAYFKQYPLKWTLSQKNISIIFLATLPIAASLGTNLGVAAKFFYFACIWLFLMYTLLNAVHIEYASLSLLFFTAIILYAHICPSINYLKNRQDNPVTSQKLSKLNGIYITQKQKDHFETLYDTLRYCGYRDGDTILAFQPDLMSVFVVNATAGRQVYFVPADFLATDLPKIKRAKFMILNDYSYAQIAKAIQSWGFPKQYQKINIGTPETEDYFNAHQPRMLFCLK